MLNNSGNNGHSCLTTQLIAILSDKCHHDASVIVCSYIYNISTHLLKHGPALNFKDYHSILSDAFSASRNTRTVGLTSG